MYRFACGIALTLSAPAVAQAALVEFTLAGSADGSVGGDAFAGAPVALIGTADPTAVDVTNTPDLFLRTFDLDTADFLIGSAALTVVEPVVASVATTADDFTFVLFDFFGADGFPADQIGIATDTLGLDTRQAFAGLVAETDSVIQPPGIMTDGGALDFASLEFLTTVQTLDGVDAIVPLPGAAWLALTALAALGAVRAGQRCGR